MNVTKIHTYVAEFLWDIELVEKKNGACSQNFTKN